MCAKPYYSGGLHHFKMFQKVKCGHYLTIYTIIHNNDSMTFSKKQYKNQKNIKKQDFFSGGVVIFCQKSKKKAENCVQDDCSLKKKRKTYKSFLQIYRFLEGWCKFNPFEFVTYMFEPL